MPRHWRSGSFIASVWGDFLFPQRAPLPSHKDPKADWQTERYVFGAEKNATGAQGGTRNKLSSGLGENRAGVTAITSLTA